MSIRRSKKSETLEVRLEHDVKSALMRKARDEGRSTSEVVRSFIDSYLAAQPKEARPMFTRIFKAAAAFGAAATAFIGLAIAPSPLHAKPDLKAVFHALDSDGDGAVTQVEFLQHTANPELRKLHEEHRSQGHGAMAAKHGGAVPANHGQPSKEMLRERFAKLDGNSDGSIQFADSTRITSR